MLSLQVSDPDRIENVLLIATYNSMDFVEGICKSIGTQVVDLSRTLLIIIDNNSTDDTYDIFRGCMEKYLRSKGINYLLVKLTKNLGFAPANNIGLYLAKHLLKSLENKTIILLNPDTYVLERTFVKKANFLTRKLPIVGFSTVSGNLNNIIDSIGAFVDFLGNPQDILCGVRITNDIGKLLRRLPLLYLTPYTCFAAVAIKGDVVEKIGFLRNDYVIYFEDTEFCLRAWSRGIPVCVFRDFMVWHARGGTQVSHQSLTNDKVRKKDVFLDIPYHFSKNQLLLTYEYLGIIRYLTRLVLYALIGLVTKHRYLAFSIIDSLRTIFKRRIKKKRLPTGLIPRNPRTWVLIWALKYLLNYSSRGLDEAVAYGVRRASFEYLKQRLIRSALGAGNAVVPCFN